MVMVDWWVISSTSPFLIHSSPFVAVELSSVVADAHFWITKAFKNVFIDYLCYVCCLCLVWRRLPPTSYIHWWLEVFSQRLSSDTDPLNRCWWCYMVLLVTLVFVIFMLDFYLVYMFDKVDITEHISLSFDQLFPEISFPYIPIAFITSWMTSIVMPSMNDSSMKWLWNK